MTPTIKKESLSRTSIRFEGHERKESQKLKNLTSLIRFTSTMFLISCVTYLRGLYTKEKLNRHFAVNLRGIINTDFECMFNKCVFSSKYTKGTFFCSKIIYDTPKIPSWFSASARHLVTRLLEKEPAHRLGSGRNGELNIKQHQFFDVSSIHICYHAIIIYIRFSSNCELSMQ